MSRSLPGPITPLAVSPTDAGKLDIVFSAAGSVAGAEPPATAYQLRRSPNDIDSVSEFENADNLACADSTPAGDCDLRPATTGQSLTVTIDPPPAGRTRYYAVRAVNDDGEPGPFAVARYTAPGSVENVTTTTTAVSTTAPAAPAVDECGEPAAPGDGQVRYPSGYSLIGLPTGTSVGSRSPLYSWFDLGAGSEYSAQAGTVPTDAGRGYWAWFKCPSVVTAAGAGVDSLTMGLGAYRASMVGNPSALGPAMLTGHDFAARWDPSLNDGAGGDLISNYREPQELAVGEGTWAFSYVTAKLSIARR